jgi:CxxC-x17-CxxC domain-containing protein
VSFADKTLTCVECGSSFVFTAGEQEFHASKGFTNEPRRCSSCRAVRRQQRSSGDDYGSGGGYGSSPRREFFSATCASCGREARVPFEPRGDKPVYCSDCFRSQPRQQSSYSGRGDRW